MIWTECYRLIAERLCAYRHRREELADLLANALYSTGISFPIADNSEELVDIDPFTFFAAFNRKMLRTSRQRLTRYICAGLGIHPPESIDFAGAPMLEPYKLRFFSKRQSQHLEIEALWQIFMLLLPLSGQAAVDEGQQQAFGAALKGFTAHNPSHRDRLQWALCWLCPPHHQSLIALLGGKAPRAPYPTDEFNRALAEAREQEAPTVDRQAFRALVEGYVAAGGQLVDGRAEKWLTVKCFSENFDLDAEDFAAMLDTALTKQNSLLENTNNFYPYTEITRLARLEPQSVRDAFGDLFDTSDNLPARCLRFCNAITILHEQHRDRFAHWQIKPCAHANFFVASIYLFMRDPSRYFLYSPTRAHRLSAAVGYRETFRPTDADVVEAYAELCEQLIECLAEEPGLVLAAKAGIEAQTGLADACNHLLLDDIIVHLCAR
ncbi:MAG: hypothetical protein LBP24_00810 [Coriobacteriales bacterium]|jgi:hypothetical protein|nr:hypothetical protein [Coriobacteriales bacterium]